MEEEKPREFVWNTKGKDIDVGMELIITKINRTKFKEIVYLENKSIWEEQHRFAVCEGGEDGK